LNQKTPLRAPARMSTTALITQAIMIRTQRQSKPARTHRLTMRI
jgi:hypothetical protein